MLLSADSSLWPQQLSDEAKADQMKAGIHSDERKQEEWKWEVLLGTLACSVSISRWVTNVHVELSFPVCSLGQGLFLLFGVFCDRSNPKYDKSCECEEAVRLLMWE